MTEPVLVDITDGVATITLNRPEARNALNRAIRHGLPTIISELEADDAVDVMILTGADPAFSAGVDLKEFGSGAVGGDELRSGAGAPGPESVDMGGRSRDGQLPWRGALPPRTKLLIGAVNGVAVTGGLELALACDFLIASERARFADTHARVGLLPTWGLSVRLPQKVGVGMARRMSMTGDYLSAADALRAGLVTEVVAHEQLMPAAHAIAASIVGNNQKAVRALLDSYHRIDTADTSTGLWMEAESAQAWMRSASGDDIAASRATVMERGRAQARQSD